MLTESKTVDSITVIYIYGSLDNNTSPVIIPEIEKIIKDNRENDILLNLKDVDFITSTGIRVLIKTKDFVEKNNGKLMLCELTSSVKDLLQVIDLVDFFNLFDSEEEVFEKA